MEYRRIGKSGGSLTVAIPNGYLQYFGLVKGDYVKVELKGEEIILKPDYGEKGKETMKRERSRKETERRIV